MSQKLSTKMPKEDVIVLFIFAFVGLAIPAVVVLQHFVGIDPLS